jgi:tetratricopeptide (TPR) repeat protein
MISAEQGSPPALCPTCGTPLPGGKWSSACPRCLIEAFGEEQTTDPADSLVAGYTILEEISRGGMGVVYRARQHHPSRIVALKMILPHLLDSPVIRARFQAEAESVAKLDHPNVLPIYEAGENRGTPYLTMKFVAGGSLAAHRAEFLGAPQACAELVAAAARGVQHAHERGILHRDLKPANLLLDAPTPDAAPTPMVSDFGLARILEAEPSGLTAPSAFLGTAGYLAPELAFGGSNAPTVQTDIYSLGAILYELISGQLPFGAATGLEALRRADRETPPSLRSLNPRIPKDLDAICLCCLQREPSSRYRSAGALADDLDRFLGGSPVVAQRDTMSYRAAKFAQRNKAGLAVAALVLLVLVGGIIATSWQARIAMKEKARAERRFNEVRTLAHSVLFDYHDAIKDLPGATKVRERLVKDALNYLDGLAGDTQGDPALQRELAAAYERVGDVRGSLGDLAGALESHTKALRIRESLFALNPNAQARRELASSHKQTGSRLLEMAEPAGSFEHFRKALALYLDLIREEPGNDDLRLAFADTCNRLGQAMKQQGDLAGALEQLRTAQATCEKLVASNPREQRYRRVLWTTLARTADVYFLQRNVADAIAVNSKALALGITPLAATIVGRATKTLRSIISVER